MPFLLSLTLFPRCVCVVIRAHMIEASREGIEPLLHYDVFKDAEFTKPTKRKQQDKVSTAQVPKLIYVTSNRSQWPLVTGSDVY